MKTGVSNCPLCSDPDTGAFSKDKFRSFRKCRACGLIFVPRAELISTQDEKLRYDAHQNSEADEGYQLYLDTTAAALAKLLPRNSRGLDFGCGRTTILANKLTRLGHETDSYDVFFQKDETIWKKKFDFIVLSEVIEHLREPREEMERLSGLLNPEGLIFIKTKFAPETLTAFENWFYKRDITHVQFFGVRSMESLREILRMKDFEVLELDLSLFRHY